ncbi:MAG: sensor histidine kinase [Bacillota bacterium]|nr:sensor histidine kinase [Bacillota bacterium]
MKPVKTAKSATLKELCRSNTALSTEDIEQLETIASAIPYFAKLSNHDIFIECFLKDEEKGIVVAHGRPEGNSQYSADITGELVLPENEPMVFFTRDTGMAMREKKAFTQEGKYVLQRTVPIKNKENRVIGVLIQESDMTSSVHRDNKLQEMGRTTERLTERLYMAENDEGVITNRSADQSSQIDDTRLMTKELHHRIKNSLQLISSILSMQERRSECEETKQALRENSSRINSIALLHEILLSDQKGMVDLNALTEKLIRTLKDFALTEEAPVSITLSGDTLQVDADKATSVLLILNELITNALRHAFKGREHMTDNTINIHFVDGSLYSLVMVTDNGMGFVQDVPGTSSAKAPLAGGSLGLDLVRILVSEKLQGELNIQSDELGTKVTFDFS